MCKNMFKLNKLGHKTVESKILAADKSGSSVTFWRYTQKLQQWYTHINMLVLQKALVGGLQYCYTLLVQFGTYCWHNIAVVH